MKILIVIDDYFNQSNGMCISTQRFAQEFKKLGHQVRIISCAIDGTPDYPLPELIVPFFKKIIAKEGYHLALPKKKILNEAISWADIVAIETPFPVSWKAAKIAKERQKPVYGTFHIFPGNITESLHINNHLFNSFFMLFFRNISFKNCVALQCPTLKVKHQLEKYHFKQKLFVISNGINEQFIDNPHKKIVGHPFTILCIGRYSREKHQEVLLKALNKLPNCKNIRVILAGKGPLEKILRKQAAKLPIKVIMKFYTPIQLRHLIAHSDLVVHCADVEVEGMACMEAFAGGCVPIIADSPLSSTVSYALSKMNKFPAGNSTILAKRINYWLLHPIELKACRIKYRKFAKNLTVKKSAQKTISMMEDISK
ncbi:glycosyltransferase [Lactobacillus sp. LL6]|uniref:glycosyltransferase n=1 Tax=Lactobacillus sp. LL6 TaxID=2596827 RepID=UPI001186EA16|nr:glycosyltransferase [Lactobacillus sp. LL6]TSO25267.1 glycosyltransferase family 4 protein [Lactobacillus sp. LL6]